MTEYPQDYVYKKVDNIVFGVLSPKMVKQMSSAKIVTPELYDTYNERTRELTARGLLKKVSVM